MYDTNWRHSEDFWALKSYWQNKIPCIPKRFDNFSLNCLRQYIEATKQRLDNITSLFIALNKPFKVPTKDSLVRWVKPTLKDACINKSIFSPHSTRSASNSKAKTHLPLKTIFETGGWKSNRTFPRFYDKPILSILSVYPLIHMIQADRTFFVI